jgi:hypothetical protein
VPDFAGLAIVAKVSHHPVALGPMGSRSSPIFLVEKLARHKNAERRRRPRACRRQPAKPSDDEASEIVTSRGRVRLPGASESALALKWIVVAYKPLNLPLTVSDVVKFSALFATARYWRRVAGKGDSCRCALQGAERDCWPPCLMTA